MTKKARALWVYTTDDAEAALGRRLRKGEADQIAKSLEFALADPASTALDLFQDETGGPDGQVRELRPELITVRHTTGETVIQVDRPAWKIEKWGEFIFQTSDLYGTAGEPCTVISRDDIEYPATIDSTDNGQAWIVLD